MKEIKIFISSNKKFILSNRINEGGDIDFIDKNKKLRNTIYKIIKRNNLIYAKRFHATGERYDIITKKLDIYSLDFLDGYETNPLFFDFSKIKNNKKSIASIFVTPSTKFATSSPNSFLTVS